MYNHETGLFENPYIPQEYSLVDGYSKREPETEWEQDFISLIDLEHEPDLEQ